MYIYIYIYIYLCPRRPTSGKCPGVGNIVGNQFEDTVRGADTPPPLAVHIRCAPPSPATTVCAVGASLPRSLALLLSLSLSGYRKIRTTMAQGWSTKIISMIKWIWTSRLSIKNSLSQDTVRGEGALAGQSGRPRAGATALAPLCTSPPEGGNSE